MYPDACDALTAAGALRWRLWRGGRRVGYHWCLGTALLRPLLEELAAGAAGAGSSSLGSGSSSPSSSSPSSSSSSMTSASIDLATSLEDALLEVVGAIVCKIMQAQSVFSFVLHTRRRHGQSFSILLLQYPIVSRVVSCSIFQYPGVS